MGGTATERSIGAGGGHAGGGGLRSGPHPRGGADRGGAAPGPGGPAHLPAEAGSARDDDGEGGHLEPDARGRL